MSHGRLIHQHILVIGDRFLAKKASLYVRALSERVVKKQIGHGDRSYCGAEAIGVRHVPRGKISAVRYTVEKKSIRVDRLRRHHGIDSGHDISHETGTPIIDDGLVGPVAIAIATARAGTKVAVPVARKVLGKWTKRGGVRALRAAVQLNQKRWLGICSLRELTDEGMTVAIAPCWKARARDDEIVW